MDEDISFLDFLGEIAEKKSLSTLNSESESSQEQPISHILSFSNPGGTGGGGGSIRLGRTYIGDRGLCRTFDADVGLGRHSSNSQTNRTNESPGGFSRKSPSVSSGEKGKKKILARSFTTAEMEGKGREDAENVPSPSPNALSAPALTKGSLDRVMEEEDMHAASWSSFAPVKLNKRSPGWMKDGQTKVCLNTTCSSKFSVTKRKHHCRLCGRIYCGNCSAVQRRLGYRICLFCRENLGNEGGKGEEENISQNNAESN